MFVTLLERSAYASFLQLPNVLYPIDIPALPSAITTPNISVLSNAPSPYCNPISVTVDGILITPPKEVQLVKAP